MASEPERWFVMGEACERLGIAPKVFRQLITDFGDLIEPLRPSTDGLGQEISEGALGLLRQAWEGRNQGQSVQEIRGLITERPYPASFPAREVAAGVEGSASSAVCEVGDSKPENGLYESLVKRIEELTEDLAKSEEHRAEDRDRMLTALMRTQQEIQHLRFELVTQQSRKERKNKGFWTRLFG